MLHAYFVCVRFCLHFLAIQRQLPCGFSCHPLEFPSFTFDTKNEVFDPSSILIMFSNVTLSHYSSLHQADIFHKYISPNFVVFFLSKSFSPLAFTIFPFCARSAECVVKYVLVREVYLACFQLYATWRGVDSTDRRLLETIHASHRLQLQEKK